MKKNFKYYALTWAILFVTYQLVVFLVKPLIPGYIKYDAVFWTAWAFIVIAFIGNLVCAFLAFRADNLQKMFYNVPLISVSTYALITMMVVGSILMLIPDFPSWIAAIICILILAFNAIAVVKASWVAEAVQNVDEKVKAQTSFIKNAIVNAESIMARTNSDEAHAACKKVYEALRYSDPMSNQELADIEEQISMKLNELKSGISSGESVDNCSEELMLLINERNKKCKLLK